MYKRQIITPYSTYDGNQAGVGNHTWTLRWPYILDAGEPYDIRTDTNSKFIIFGGNMKQRMMNVRLVGSIPKILYSAVMLKFFLGGLNA